MLFHLTGEMHRRVESWETSRELRGRRRWESFWINDRGRGLALNLGPGEISGNRTGTCFGCATTAC